MRGANRRWRLRDTTLWPAPPKKKPASLEAVCRPRPVRREDRRSHPGPSWRRPDPRLPCVVGADARLSREAGVRRRTVRTCSRRHWLRRDPLATPHTAPRHPDTSPRDRREGCGTGFSVTNAPVSRAPAPPPARRRGQSSSCMVAPATKTHISVAPVVRNLYTTLDPTCHPVRCVASPGHPRILKHLLFTSHPWAARSIP